MSKTMKSWIIGVAAFVALVISLGVPQYVWTQAGQWVNLETQNVIFEGTTIDAFEATLTVTDPTADVTITLPNATGSVNVYDTVGTDDVSIIFEGATADAFEATVTVTDPTADVTITVPDSTFTVGRVAANIRFTTAALHIDTDSFFIADRAYIVENVRAVWETAESAAGDVMIENLSGTETCSGGDDILAAVIDTTTTAATVASPALHATAANYTMAAGDRLCVDFTSTNGELIGFQVTVHLLPD